MFDGFGHVATNPEKVGNVLMGQLLWVRDE
jgi:hypothetical protein